MNFILIINLNIHSKNKLSNSVTTKHKPKLNNNDIKLKTLLNDLSHQYHDTNEVKGMNYFIKLIPFDIM